MIELLDQEDEYMFPIWGWKDELQEKEGEIEDLKDEIRDLQEELEELRKENDALKDRIIAIEAANSACNGSRTRQWENLLNYCGKPQNGDLRGCEGDSDG